jgi:hypothetical protein
MPANGRRDLIRPLKIKAGGHKFSQNLGATSKIPGTIWVTCSKFRTEDLQTLGAAKQNSVTLVTWQLAFVQTHILV